MILAGCTFAAIDDLAWLAPLAAPAAGTLTAPGWRGLATGLEQGGGPGTPRLKSVLRKKLIKSILAAGCVLPPLLWFT